jgi:hypothetical protein
VYEAPNALECGEIEDQFLCIIKVFWQFRISEKGR